MAPSHIRHHRHILTSIAAIGDASEVDTVDGGGRSLRSWNLSKSTRNEGASPGFVAPSTTITCPDDELIELNCADLREPIRESDVSNEQSLQTSRLCANRYVLKALVERKVLERVALHRIDLCLIYVVVCDDGHAERMVLQAI